MTKLSLEEIPLNSFHKKLTIYSAGGPFLDGYALSIIGVAMVQLSNRLDLSSFWQGLIAASALIGAFLGGFIGGWFTDLYGRKILYMIDLISIVVLSVAQMWVQNGFELFIIRLGIGIAVGADYPIATSLLAEFLPKKERGPLLASLVVVWFAGAAAAYVVGDIILRYGGEDAWRWVLVSAAVPGLIFFLGRSGIPESPRWLMAKNEEKRADDIVKKVYGKQYSSDDLPAIVDSELISVRRLFHSEYGRRMKFVCVFWTCAIVPLFAVYAFAPKVLLALHLTGTWAAYGSVVITALFVVGCVGGMKLINILGRRKMLVSSFLLSGTSLLFLALFSNASSFCILLFFGAYALFIGGAQVLSYIYPNELFPTEVRASAVGLSTSISRIGAVIGTYFVPVSLTSLGIAKTMGIAAAISFFGAWYSWREAPETSGLDLTQTAKVIV
ncbi:MFS transporter [Acetobacter sp.]|uniref:MFS transporter n=1 Tax=Acetobacter sp. TaxID=440 RepID=UPI0039EB9A6E